MEDLPCMQVLITARSTPLAGLQALQADEVAREAERRRRSHAKQRSHGRNAELAAADVEAAQARVDALHYRLDGKSAQAAVTTCHRVRLMASLIRLDGKRASMPL